MSLTLETITHLQRLYRVVPAAHVETESASACAWLWLWQGVRGARRRGAGVVQYCCSPMLVVLQTRGCQTNWV